jgi:GT2 family glycosyltransferase
VKLSIIVVNYRSWGHLRKALDALQADFPTDWELIVIDNESQAEPFEEFAAKYPWVSFIAHAHNSGFGFACNLGVAEASGARLLFMNPDVIATCGDIEALLLEQQKHPRPRCSHRNNWTAQAGRKKSLTIFPACSTRARP